MQKGNTLEFTCQACNNPILFSVFDLDNENEILACALCQKKYLFDDKTLNRQLKKFEALCRQILESEEILSQTSVGIDLGEHHIKIPYKILLTRLNSCLDLTIGNQPVSIRFRLEPLKDLPLNKKD